MNRELIVDGCLITDDSDCYVIAEIGHNHQGDLDKARQLFCRAKECGANAVKLQKRDNRSLYTRVLYNAPYNSENSFGATYGEHREALEFGKKEYTELKRYAKELGITMFATAFDFSSANFLAELDMPAYKISSGDSKNIPLIKFVAQIGKPMLISTGGLTMEDVQRIYDVILPINSQLCIMQCTATYPADPKDMNLRVICNYRQRFPDIVIGLSDHQNGISMSLVGYMLGARVIEKHFTLNRSMKGTDHSFSLEPIGLRKLVRDLGRARIAMGDGIKRPLECEKQALFKMGKKLVAAHDILDGHVLTPLDISIKSPNDGLPPYELENIVGKRTLKTLKEDESILLENLSDR